MPSGDNGNEAAVSRRRGPVAMALRAANCDSSKLRGCQEALVVLASAAQQHQMTYRWYALKGNVDPDVFSYAIEAAEALGI